MTQNNRLYDNEVFTHGDRSFRVKYESDLDTAAPWLECDGHGVVSEWTTRSKRPGERVLSSDRNSRRYYDVAATLAIARADQWGTVDGKRPGETDRQYAVRAVDFDFEYCKGWTNDTWQYLCVVVSLASNADISTSLCGVESFDREYPSTVARELAEELSAEIDRDNAIAADNARIALAVAYGFGA